jgi:hypothetical protein
LIFSSQVFYFFGQIISNPITRLSISYSNTICVPFDEFETENRSKRQCFRSDILLLSENKSVKTLPEIPVGIFLPP